MLPINAIIICFWKHLCLGDFLYMLLKKVMKIIHSQHRYCNEAYKQFINRIFQALYSNDDRQEKNNRGSSINSD